jgi:hypothetical protein
MLEPCYTQVEYKLDGPGLFEDCLDAAYLLTMSNSTRDWLTEYQKHRPYSSLVVQYNQGFKNCHKPQLFEQRSDSDLADSLGQIFRTALARNQTRILVLEDDFIFDHYDAKDIQNISTFIQSRNMDMYHLGTYSLIGVPGPHIRILQAYHTHGMIYCSPRYMTEYLEALMARTTRIVTDHFYNSCRYVKYHYKKPICFQLFPVTENSFVWDPTGEHRKFIRQYELDTSYKQWSTLFDTAIAKSVILIFVVPALSLLLLAIGIYLLVRCRRRI